MLTNVKTLHVPCKGGVQALTDVVSGQVHMHFAVVVSALAQFAALMAADFVEFAEHVIEPGSTARRW